MVDLTPVTAGINCTVTWHACWGANCRGQFEAPFPNPNSCGLVIGTLKATGLAKVIGGPFWAEFINANVTDLSCPTVTSPKS